MLARLGYIMGEECTYLGMCFPLCGGVAIGCTVLDEFCLLALSGLIIFFSGINHLTFHPLLEAFLYFQSVWVVDQ